MTTAVPFDALLAAHVPRVHRATLGFLRDEEEAREAAQEALLKAHRARDRYDPSRPFYPWLYRIVKNTCLDAMARRRHRAAPGLDADRVESPTASAEIAVDEARSHARLAAAMATLSPDHQEVLNMRHFQDLAYAEIAELLGVAEGTVMSRLYRARRALADAMRETP